MHRIISSILLVAALLVLAACGNADKGKPDVSQISVACTDSGDDDVGNVVDFVAVSVADPDGDLVSVEGRINGVQITLTDDDADEVYTWQPPPDSEPMACRNDFFVEVTASDQAGNLTTSSKVITK